MFKIILLLVTLNGVLCAPAVRFTEYGTPGEINLAEKSLPWKKLQPVIPENLPGTRNLGEKSIPDRITLQKLPQTSEISELPWHTYDGGFIISSGNRQAAAEDRIAGYQIPIYPNPTPDDKDHSEIKGTEINPSANKPSTTYGPPNIGNNVLSTSEDRNPISIPPDSSIKLQDIHNQYSHGFSSPDGTQVEESGHLISTDDGWEYVIAKVGSYQYISPEGIPISVRYIADENGFRILGQDIGNRHARQISPQSQ